MDTVIAFGTFDRLHFGHVQFLLYAKKQGAKLVVVVGRDATVKKVKGKKTRVTEKDRVQAVRNLGIADTVVLGHKTNRLARITQYNPSVICLGYDQRMFVDTLKAHLKKERSTARIVRAPAYKPGIHKSSFATQNTPLLRGVVGKGRGEGTPLGFPTANIMAPTSARAALAPGIYAARVLYNNTEHIAAAAVGIRQHRGAPLVEAHILDLSKNLYGSTLTIALDKKIRHCKTYKTIPALQKAIQHDILQIRKYYGT